MSFVSGYYWEGDAAYVSTAAESRASTIPLYRMYNPSVVDHFYTTSYSEVESATANGNYTLEGIAAYVYGNSNMCGSVPLFRLYSAGEKDHFYTTSEPEVDHFINNLGYVSEGIAAYVLPSPANFFGYGK